MLSIATLIASSYFVTVIKSQCLSTEIACVDTTFYSCVTSEWECDGDNDCGDCTDEPSTCPSSTIAPSCAPAPTPMAVLWSDDYSDELWDSNYEISDDDKIAVYTTYEYDGFGNYVPVHLVELYSLPSVYMIRNPTSTVNYYNLILNFTINIGSLPYPNGVVNIEYSISNDVFRSLKQYTYYDSGALYTESVTLPQECEDATDLRIKMSIDGDYGYVYLYSMSLLGYERSNPSPVETTMDPLSQCNYYHQPTSSGIILISTEECAVQMKFGQEAISIQYECISESLMIANYYSNGNCNGFAEFTEEYQSDTEEIFNCAGSSDCNTATISQTCDAYNANYNDSYYGNEHSLTIITDFCFNNDINQWGASGYGVTKCNEETFAEDDEILMQYYYDRETECIDAYMNADYTGSEGMSYASDLLQSYFSDGGSLPESCVVTSTCSNVNDYSDNTGITGSKTAAGFIGSLDLAASIAVLIVLILVGIGCFIGILCCICCCSATQKHAIGAKEVSKQTEMTLTTTQPITTTKGNQTTDTAKPAYEMPGEVPYNETASNHQMTEEVSGQNDDIAEMQVSDNNYPSLETANDTAMDEGIQKESVTTSASNGDLYESKEYEAFNAMLNDEKYALVKEFIYEKVIILGECRPIYFKALIESGCDTLEKVKELSNQDLVDMGINSTGDRRMIMIKAKMIKL